MKFKNKTHLDDGYVEIDGLFVEWDYATSCSDPGNADGDLYICNVQLPHPSDPADESKWLDITDHLTAAQKETLAEQVIEMQQDEIAWGAHEPL